MRKIIATLLTCTMAVSLAACGNASLSTPAATAAPATEAIAQPESSRTDAATGGKKAPAGEGYTLKFTL